MEQIENTESMDYEILQPTPHVELVFLSDGSDDGSQDEDMSNDDNSNEAKTRDNAGLCPLDPSKFARFDEKQLFIEPAFKDESRESHEC